MKAVESWTCKMLRLPSHDAACCCFRATLIQQHRRPLPWLPRLYHNIARAASLPPAYNTYRPQQAPASCQRDAFRHVYGDIKRGPRLISVGVQSAVFHRRESECDKTQRSACLRLCIGDPVGGLQCPRCSSVKKSPYHRGLPFPTCLRRGLMWGTKESFAANNLQSGRNLSGCSSR